MVRSQQNSQDEIYKQILSQLEVLGKHLSNIENKASKKVSNTGKVKKSGEKISQKGHITQACSVPLGGTPAHSAVAQSSVPPPVLREESHIQQEVQARLRHLAENAKTGSEKN